jgi:hypothetical protein
MDSLNQYIKQKTIYLIQLQAFPIFLVMDLYQIEQQHQYQHKHI